MQSTAVPAKTAIMQIVKILGIAVALEIYHARPSPGAETGINRGNILG
jgi:hypothetical protein